MTEKVHIFLLCNNEEAIIRQTIEHYRKYLDSPEITILNNESTDKSREIALEMGCHVIEIETQGLMNEFVLTNLKNDCWKEVTNGWCIIVDMDEWLIVSQKELLEEEQHGTTILYVHGYNMMAKSESVMLTDIDLHEIVLGYPYERENKSVCFKRPEINAMNYDYGAHRSFPDGRVQYSGDRIYKMKHMAWLGLPHILDKMKRRQERAEHLKNLYGINRHYFETEETFMDEYYENLEKSADIFSK